MSARTFYLSPLPRGSRTIGMGVFTQFSLTYASQRGGWYCCLRRDRRPGPHTAHCLNTAPSLLQNFSLQTSTTFLKYLITTLRIFSATLTVVFNSRYLQLDLIESCPLSSNLPLTGFLLSHSQCPTSTTSTTTTTITPMGWTQMQAPSTTGLLTS